MDEIIPLALSIRAEGPTPCFWDRAYLERRRCRRGGRWSKTCVASLLPRKRPTPATTRSRGTGARMKRTWTTQGCSVIWPRGPRIEAPFSSRTSSRPTRSAPGASRCADQGTPCHRPVGRGWLQQSHRHHELRLVDRDGADRGGNPTTSHHLARDREAPFRLTHAPVTIVKLHGTTNPQISEHRGRYRGCSKERAKSPSTTPRTSSRS